MTVNPIISPVNAKPGTWVYKVNEKGSTLCFVASWQGSNEPIFIEIHEKGAHLSKSHGDLYPVSQIDIVPNYTTARAGMPPRSGMICSTQTKILLIYTANNQLSEADLSNGVSPQNASHAIGFTDWDIFSYGQSGAKKLISVSI